MNPDMSREDVTELQELFYNRKDWILKLFECEYAIIRARQRQKNKKGKNRLQS